MSHFFPKCVDIGVCRVFGAAFGTFGFNAAPVEQLRPPSGFDPAALAVQAGRTTIQPTGCSGQLEDFLLSFSGLTLPLSSPQLRGFIGNHVVH